MTFQIIPLEKDKFAPLFELDDAALKAIGAMRMVVDEKPGYPCRTSLEDAEVGETVLLLNYEHLSVDTPYCAKAAIFVRRDGPQANPAPNEIPPSFLDRVVAARAFDKEGMMVDADIAQGAELADLIERLLKIPVVDYLHLHWAKFGCYAAKVVET